MFSELLIGKPPFRGNKDLDQLNSIFEKCGTPNEINWPEASSLPKYSLYLSNRKKDYVWSLRDLYLDNDR